MAFTNIKYIIPESAKQHQAESQFIKYKIIAAWEKVAPGFFAECVELTKAINFEKGTLTVACLSKELCTSIRQVCQQILHALNEFLGRELVYSLVVEI